jgi:hypothetical protein
MASVTKMTREHGKQRPVKPGEKPPVVFYQVRWKTPDNQSRKKNFDLKRDADRHAASIEGSKASGLYIDRADGQKLFGTYARAYVESTKRASLTERAWIDVDGRLRNHLLPVLENRPLLAITTEDVRGLLANLTLEKELSAATVKPVYHLLNKIMARAVIDRKISFNPCDGIDAKFDLPQEEEGPEMLFLTHAEIELLANAIVPR